MDARTLNTKTGAPARYDNFPYVSLFRVGDFYFGISEAGIELLRGGDDLGQPIQADVITGVTDLRSNARMVVTDAYLEGRCEGGMSVSTVLDEGQTLDYEAAPSVSPGIHFRRIKFGRGVDTSHIQFRVRNIDGAAFGLRSLRVNTQLKTRR